MKLPTLSALSKMSSREHNDKFQENKIRAEEAHAAGDDEKAAEHILLADVHSNMWAALNIRRRLADVGALAMRSSYRAELRREAAAYANAAKTVLKNMRKSK